MSVEEKMATAHRRRQEEEQPARDKRREDDSRQKLLNVCRTKMRTTFIGALARFEEHFGTRIWGHGKPPASRNEQEKLWAEIWEDCRGEILNHANHQLRAMEQEIHEYKVWWEGHHVEFSVCNINNPTPRRNDVR